MRRAVRFATCVKSKQRGPTKSTPFEAGLKEQLFSKFQET